MHTRALVSKVGKGLLTANLATLVRLVRHGSRGLDRRLSRVYQTIDPFDSADQAYTLGMLYQDMPPHIDLGAIVRNFVSLNLDEEYQFINGVKGAMPWIDLVALLTVVHDRQPKCMFEIGTYFGYTTRVLALNFPATTIHTIDLPESFDLSTDTTGIPKDDFHLINDRRVGEAFRSDAAIGNVVQHFGDTANWDFEKVKDATLFFIDGSHTYEYIRNDTEKCLALCKDRRATFLWHDCDVGHPGVLRYLAELVEAQFPIRRIVDTHLAILDI